jgi:phosphate/sulfate permease
MIVSFFINLAYNIVSSFLNLFPNADLSFLTNINTAVAAASGYLSSVSYFAPVSTLLTIVGLFIGIEIVILVIKIINWIIRKIPTIS